MVNKLPYQSKKFIGFIFAVLVLAAICGMIVFTQAVGWITGLCLLGGILTVGAISIGYIMGQAGLDKYVAIAETLTNIGPHGDNDDKVE